MGVVHQENFIFFLKNSNIKIEQFEEYDELDDFIEDFDNRKNEYIETLNKLKQ